MDDFKKQAAHKGLELIKKGMTVGLGAGATVAHLVHALAMDSELASSLRLLSPSAETRELIRHCGFVPHQPEGFDQIDLYFDGCDQVDRNFNALKSGAGIHTDEKIFAGMAKEFIILVDSSKLVDRLDNRHPLVLEIIPSAIQSVQAAINRRFPRASFTIRTQELPDTGNNLVNTRGNLLADIRFGSLPPLAVLDGLKMIPGVVDHSLFYQLAGKVVSAGSEGIETLSGKPAAALPIDMTIVVFPSADLKRDIEWYTKNLGLLVYLADPMYAVLYRDNFCIHLQWHAGTADDPLQAGSVLRILVKEVRPFYKELLELGIIEAAALKTNTPWGTDEFGFYDLNGNAIYFMSDVKTPAVTSSPDLL